MATLRLPDELRKNLLALSKADDNAVEELYERLSTLEVNMTSDALADELASRLTRWESYDGIAAVTALLAICAFRAQAGHDAQRAASEVLTALRRRVAWDPEGNLVLKAGDEPKLRERLLRFLNLSALNVTAKALGVLTDHQRAYISARILSDIRPVFSEEVPPGPAAAVIVHSLKIEFMENGERREFFVALDSKDVRSMLTLLDRAQKKDTALRALVATSKLPFLEPK